MEGKPENRMQEVSAGQIGRQIQAYVRLIQAVTHYYGTSPTGSNTTDLHRKQFHKRGTFAE